MAIEKVFAISGSANDVYTALQRDIAAASAYEGDVFEVLRRDRDRLIELRVTIGGVPGILTYTLDEESEHTEVAASFDPHGWRWILFNVATLGMRRNSIEMVLVQGLVNLKAEVEGDEAVPEVSEEAPPS